MHYVPTLEPLKSVTVLKLRAIPRDAYNTGILQFQCAAIESKKKKDWQKKEIHCIARSGV
jgi:hypothetical protein